ncbi:dipeptidase [Cohnella soli]|uniref:Dipeptidase n=1 Tax=Cohnella soli TaxID=425005 RepID=A0ABW0HLS9_9BACL
MRIVDMHVDVICKLLSRPKTRWDATGAELFFDTTPERMTAGGIGLQVFALFLPEELPSEPETVFQGAELFWSEVLAAKGMKLIRRSDDLEAASRENKIGALLSLEGVDGLQGKMWALRMLHRLGLRLLGPTWNHSNWACDGALEPRGAGLTEAGRTLVKECEKLGILVDVSHLSDAGFWDVAEMASRPFFASHSNARAIVDNPRNLTDSQIQTIVSAQGIIGITFVPWFLTEEEPASIDDVLRHVEHVCALGGETNLAFGSDFDGIPRHVAGLSHPGQYPALTEALLKRYPQRLVEGFLGDNAYRFLFQNLPK